MKRLAVDISNELHKEIKIRAMNRNIPMTQWLLLAINDFIINKERYEIYETDIKRNEQ